MEEKQKDKEVEKIEKKNDSEASTLSVSVKEGIGAKTTIGG